MNRILYLLSTLPFFSALSLAGSRIKEMRKFYRQFNALIEEKIIFCFESGSLAQMYNNKSMNLIICSLTATKISSAEEVTDKLVFNDNSSLSTVSIPQSGTNDLKSTRDDRDNK